MKKREREYHQSKRVQKYLNSIDLSYIRMVRENLRDWHIAGTKVWLDEENKVMIRPLTIDECLEMEDKLPIDGITIERVPDQSATNNQQLK